MDRLGQPGINVPDAGPVGTGGRAGGTGLGDECASTGRGAPFALIDRSSLAATSLKQGRRAQANEVDM